MNPTELKPIVDAYGGPELFAPHAGVKPRLVYYWLSGEREMRPATAILVRNLPKAKKIAHSAK